jgi:TonB family protein
MKDIELPPDAPRYGDLAPMKPAEVKRSAQPRPERTPERSDFDAMLKRLKVPDMAAAPVPVEPPPVAPKPTVAPPKHPSLSEEMTSDLDRELQDLKKFQTLPPVKHSEPVQEVKRMFNEPQPAVSTPSMTASIAKARPDTALKVDGISRPNQYWGRVQARIGSFWKPPQVELPEKAVVVIKFRLERDGKVGSMLIEQSSGNEYYDLAAKRAIQSAVPLPPFTADLTESFYDAHFTFVVGEAAG